jgi:hypothetical protein
MKYVQWADEVRAVGGDEVRAVGGDVPKNQLMISKLWH